MTQVDGIYFRLFGSDRTGLVTITATDDNDYATKIVDVSTGKCFLTGRIVNETPQAYQLRITALNNSQAEYLIPAYATVKFTKCAIESAHVAVNGTVRLRGIGFVTLDPLNTEATDQMLMISGVEIIQDDGRVNRYDTTTHTDISTATTTTVAAPTTGFTIRVYKITVAVQGAARPVVEWTASGGGSANVIGTLNFSAEGVFAYDFGDKGYVCENGVDGILRIISNNTAVLDIDVVFRSD